MQEISILIVEDNEEQIDLYKTGIEEFNEERHGFKIVPVFERKFEAADSAIRSQYFDTAFIDLNLTGSSGELQGKEIVKAIRENSRYPIYIVSGSIDEDMRTLAAENSFIEACDRDEFDTFKTLTEEVMPMYKSGITKVFGSKGLIEEALHKTFWEHLAPSKKYWLTHELNGKVDLEKIILRYALTHIQEYMEHNTDGQKVQYDPAEMYIKPAVKPKMHTGNIIKKEEEIFLVLSPACDIAKGCENFIIVKLFKLMGIEDIVSLKSKEPALKTKFEEAESYLHNVWPQNPAEIKDVAFKAYDAKKDCQEKYEKAVNKTKDMIQKFVANNKGERYHFLPGFLDFEAHIADFQEIQTVKSTEVEEYTSGMTVSTSFLKDIQARFSSYYARQGSPDFNFKALATTYYEKS